MVLCLKFTRPLLTAKTMDTSRQAGSTEDRMGGQPGGTDVSVNAVEVVSVMDLRGVRPVGFTDPVP